MKTKQITPKTTDTIIIKSETLPAEKIDAKYIINNFKETKVMEYGKNLQTNIVNFTNNILANISSKELVDYSDKLCQLSKAIKQTDRIRNGKLNWIQNIKYFFIDKIEDIKNATSTTLEIVDKIELEIKGQQIQLVEDTKNYDKMQKLSYEFIKALNTTITSAQDKITEAKSFLSKYEKDESKEEEVHMLYNYVDVFEHRIHDLQVTKALIESQIPSIEIAKRANIVQSNKIDVIVTNTIPLWKQSMVHALYLAHSERAVNCTKLVTDMTNELIKSNADNVKETTKKIAIENERPIIDAETIEYSNRKIIETLQDLNKIMQEGKANRIKMIEKIEKNQKDTQDQINNLVHTQLSDNQKQIYIVENTIEE